MRKVLVLLLLSVLASTAAFASTSTTFGYGEGQMTTSSFGAYVTTTSWVGPEDLTAKVSVAYEDNGLLKYSHSSITDERNSVSTHASVPSGKSPLYAQGFHSITIEGLGSFSGDTDYVW